MNKTILILLFALGCPFCMTMITDGIKEKEVDVKVKDIAEVMLDSAKNE